MNWQETNEAILALKAEFANLPMRTKENTTEYEALARPLRKEARSLHYTRIKLNMGTLYV